MAYLLTKVLLFVTLTSGIRRRQADGESEEALVSDGVALVRNGEIKNALQKSWAAERMLDMEHKKCNRHSFPVRHKAKWWWQKCPRGWNNAGFACRTCNGEEEGLFRCWEKCGASRNLPQLSHRCTNWYCTASAQECTRHVTRLVTSWAKVAINLAVNVEGLENAKEILEGSSDMFTLQEILNGVLKPTVMYIIKKTNRTLREYMAREKLELPTMEAIIKGGAEIVALSAAAALKDYFKDIFMNVMRALDFTGISKAIHAFDAGENCRDLKVTPMPRQGLVDEHV